jgi:uncharacterized protein (DUF58 family)
VLGDVVERAATAAASLGVALLAYKLPVGLVTNGRDPQSGALGVALRPVKGDGQRQLLLQVIGRLEVGHSLDIWALLNEQPLPWGGTTMLVLSDLRVEHLPAITALRRRGQQVVLVLVDASAKGRVLARQQHLVTYSVDRQGVPVTMG